MLSEGSRLGPYEITNLLGAGGMGEVYRARDTRLGREVAVKILPRDVAADPERLARFQREARTASALNHPNIVTIHDFSSADGETWLVMELIKGSSLRDLMGNGALPMRRLLSLGAGIAEGLAAAHAAGLVHRDLKPENVMVTADGTPKILDFGLVKETQPANLTDSPTQQIVSRHGMTVGTAAYMSPEQARGAPLDFRSDHFSLGLILDEMARGKHPFGRATSFETLTAILNEDPPPLGPDVPEPLAWIIERCLAKDPAGRYGSTTDLARDLARLRDRGSIDSTRTVSPLHAPQKTWWKAAAAIALVVALGAAAFAGWRMRSAPAASADPIHTEVAFPELVELIDGEVMSAMAISPDGRHLAVNGINAIGTNQLWVRDLRTGTSRLLAEHAFAPTWSEDGTEIAFFSGGKLKSVAVAGGPARTICDAEPESSPWWQGDTILFGQYSKKRGLFRVNSSGGEPELVVGPTPSPNFSLPFWPQILPDGKRFLYVALHPDGEGRSDLTRHLKVGTFDGKASQHVPGVGSRALSIDGRLLFVRDGTLMTQPFDPAAGLSGEARPIVDDLHYFRSTGLATFSVSRNGILAWSPARPPSRLVWVDRNGMEIESIGSAVFDTNGRLSGDGKRYAVGVVDPRQGVSDIWIYDLARGSAERATFSMVDEKAPVWARDGQTIYYRSDGGSGPPDIRTLRPGAHTGPILYRGPSVEEPKDVSPDGKWLLFASFFVTGTDIYALPLEGADPKPRPIANTPFDETSPRFSPDGKWIAYASDLSGRPEIYVQPFGSEEGRAVRLSRDGGTRPRWRPDGQELYYLGPEGRIMTVPFTGTFGTPKLLFQDAATADFEPSGDGSRFLMQLQPRSMAPSVRLLINWQSALR